ncbi:nitrogen fixation protein NifR [Staphylococcus aureus]|nr:nitrogen fixation protein NifR [Staphylococcus aureus]MDR8690520.1 nitrogen fixation protein NifR [Staphylococcus aureus]PSM69531.1 nitrogen fixation protein NifR [Staphylococcus aureus]PSN03774.1 nitrogen fixation protein NifR [Staphylococcus aureus]PZI16396.1 nitrogen fixation protein NifR [Staphylococcus aureus]
MTKIKCTCNKHFSIIVRGPNTEADEKSAYDNVQVGVWAPTQRNWNTNFYRQCRLAGPQHREFRKRNSTGNAGWGTTIKKYFFFITLCPTHFPKY